jgi:hypothetical protein
MPSVNNQSSTRADDQDRRAIDLPNEAHLESLTQKATKFVSGPWGTITLFGTLAASDLLICGILMWGRVRAFGFTGD